MVGSQSQSLQGCVLNRSIGDLVPEALGQRLILSIGEQMKYQVTVTKERDRGDGIPGYRDDTIFQQNFEELDLAALAIFLNTPATITDGSGKTFRGDGPLLPITETTTGVYSDENSRTLSKVKTNP